MIIALIPLLFACVLAQNDYFYVQNSKLYDPNGVEFLIRGINNMDVYFDGWNRNFAQASLPAIAATHANTVRMVWLTDVSALSLDDQYLDGLIQTAVDNSLAVILELNDGTCKNDPALLMKMAQWFADNVALWNKYSKYIFLNIANEWSPDTPEEWRDNYITAVQTIRASGWQGPLVIDSRSCGQDPDTIIQYGNAVLQSDSAQNILFSLHMYTAWQDPDGYNIGDKLSQVQNQGLAFIVGEFASTFGMNCQYTTLDATEIMQQCTNLDIGYLGWSWNGNIDCTDANGNGLKSPLDIVSTDSNSLSGWTSSSYSDWGNLLIYSPGIGIWDTGKKATIFN